MEYPRPGTSPYDTREPARASQQSGKKCTASSTGSMTRPERRPARVVVLAQLDRFANGVKAREIERVLTARGHVVELIDTYHLARASPRRGQWAARLPGPGARRSAL